jgi:hypothetical protein
VEVYLHSLVRLYDVLLNKLSTGDIFTLFRLISLFLKIKKADYIAMLYVFISVRVCPSVYPFHKAYEITLLSVCLWLSPHRC